MALWQERAKVTHMEESNAAVPVVVRAMVGAFLGGVMGRMALGTFGGVVGASLGAGAGVYLATFQPWPTPDAETV